MFTRLSNFTKLKRIMASLWFKKIYVIWLTKSYFIIYEWVVLNFTFVVASWRLFQGRTRKFIWITENARQKSILKRFLPNILNNVTSWMYERRLPSRLIRSFRNVVSERVSPPARAASLPCSQVPEFCN